MNKSILNKTLLDLAPNFILFIFKDFESKYKTNMFTKMNMWRQGFLGESSLFYFRDYDVKDYLSDYARLKTRFINGNYSLLLDDKLIFERTFSNQLPIPKTYFLISDVISNVDSGEHIKNEALKSFLKKQKKVVVKPRSRGGGKDIYILDYKNKNFHINNEIKDVDIFFDRLLHDKYEYILTEFLQQAEYSNRIYSNSLNSIRILAFRDPYKNKICISRAVHRFGNARSGVTDNFSNQGIVAEVDLKTGVLGKGFCYRDKKLHHIENHIDTGERIEGVIVPNWEMVVKKIYEFMDNNVGIKYVGWDVAITENSFYVVEGNNYTNSRIFQVIKPFLIDEDLKNFYTYYNII